MKKKGLNIFIGIVLGILISISVPLIVYVIGEIVYKYDLSISIDDSVLSIIIFGSFAIWLILALYFIFRKNKTIITKTIGISILVVYVLLGIYGIGFPLFERIYFQNKCSEYGEYELGRDYGMYKWSCIGLDGKVLDPKSGEEITKYWQE